MAKRFTSTDIWKEDWFLELPQEYMLAWFYIKDNCNHAGIWKPNKRQLEFITRSQISLNTLLSLLNNEKERIVVLESGSWYLSDFIAFQYGTVLNENNRVHASIVKELNACKIDTCNFEVKERSFRPQDNPNQGVKDKDKEKDIDKDIVVVVDNNKSANEKFATMLLESEKLITTIQFQTKLNKNDTKELVDMFVSEMDTTNEYHPNYSDYSKHCINWCKHNVKLVKDPASKPGKLESIYNNTQLAKLKSQQRNG